MSFLYAGNYNNRIYVLADTKVSFSSEAEKNMFCNTILKRSQEEFDKLRMFGIIKNVIINSNTCIGFAGQLKDFNKLLKIIESQNINDIDIIKNIAKKINIESSGKTDFIIAYIGNTMRVFMTI